jgi:uncharacterized membrane protein YecN with MAPEG domain
METTIMHTSPAALRRRIMRRVWYAYGMSIVMSKAFVQGFLFGASAIAFWKLVSIMSIIRNFMSVPMGSIPGHILNSFMQAEIVVIFCFGILLFTGLSFGLKLPRIVLAHMPKFA